MSRIGLPDGSQTAGQTGHVSDHNAIADYLQLFRDSYVFLDEFSGSDDDAKFAAARTYAASQTHPPAIQFLAREYEFSDSWTPYAGVRLRGAYSGQMNAELGDPNVCTLFSISTSGPWCNNTAETLDGGVQGIAFSGSSASVLFGGGGLYHCWHWRDCSMQQFSSIFGTQSTKVLMTACTLDGYWQMQGMYHGAVHIGGSDNRLFMGQTLSATQAPYQTSSAGEFTYWFDGLDNTYVGPIYESCIDNRGGVKVTGHAYNSGTAGTNQGMITMLGPTIEGGDAGDPASGGKACNGAVLRVEGGQLKVFGGYLGRGMVSPSAMGHSPVDAGLVHVEGGAVLLSGVTYDMSTPNTEASFLSVYNNGGKVRLRDGFTGTKARNWSGLPRVHAASGTITADDSFTVV